VGNYISGIGQYMLLLCLFRLEIKDHLKEIAIINAIISAVTLFIYEGKGYAPLAPLAWLILTLFFLVGRRKIRLTWALFIAVVGFVAYQLVSGIIVFGWPGGYFRPTALHDHIWRNYVVDALSGVAGMWVAALFARLQWGFNFEFAKVRRWESGLVYICTISMFGIMTWIVTQWAKSWIGACGMSIIVVGLAAYLAFGAREEVRQNSILRSGMWWLKKDESTNGGE
jgi:hypothetical protein